MRTQDPTLTGRRKFLKLSGGLAFLLTAQGILPACRLGDRQSGDATVADLGAWVDIHSDGTITILNPSSEMGQGSMTALAVIVAEEMDADWEHVHIRHAPAEPETYGLTWSGELGGPMITAGSRTVRGYYRHLRHAGAQVRYALMRAAAEAWQVPQDELSTEPSVVVHSGSGRRMTYGEVAGLGQEIAAVPEVPEAEWKDPADFRLIGHALPRWDTPAKVDGSALYASDIILPGMVFGVIRRAPVHGSRPRLQNAEAVKKLPGVLDIVELDHGIGVIADSTHRAIKAKNALRIDWSADAPAANHNSEAAFSDYVAAFDRNVPGEVISSTGDPEGAYRRANRRFSADYRNDYVYHAQMEPLNAVVSLEENGKRATVWAGTQAPDRARAAAAEVLGLDYEQVDFYPCYLGGGFGRRSLTGFVAEAALLAKSAGRPLKLIWTREDDVRYGAFRPLSLQRLRAGVDREGRVLSWSHRIMGPGDSLIASGASNPFYNFPNQHIERHGVDHGIRTKHWRAVGHGPNKFAIEAFLDEIAAAMGIDPVDFRMRQMDGHPRARKVLERAAEMADWGSAPPAGRARGLACSEHGGSFSAAVCELSLRNGRELRVHRFWAALDAGVVVQPENARRQMEGAIIMGLSSVLKERITFEEGAVQQSNYNDYPILGIAECPEAIHIDLIDSEAAPGGIGESGIPLVGGAVANAFAALTGKRLRHMPFTPERVGSVLNRPVSSL